MKSATQELMNSRFSINTTTAREIYCIIEVMSQIYVYLNDFKKFNLKRVSSFIPYISETPKTEFSLVLMNFISVFFLIFE